MDFILKENVFLDECEEIFEENKNSDVFDKSCIRNPVFLKIVCLFANIPVGYIAIYPHADFLQKEGLNFKFDVEPNAVYIWHVAVKKAFEGKGVASLLIDEVVQRYSARPIYSTMEEMNSAVIQIHQRNHFVPFVKFKKQFGGQNVNLLMMKRK